MSRTSWSRVADRSPHTLMTLDAPREKLLVASGVALGAYAGLRVLGSRLRQSMLEKETIVCELEHLGKPRPEGEKLKGTAVVCGGRYVRWPSTARQGWN